jgi:hypothetical protein
VPRQEVEVRARARLNVYYGQLFRQLALTSVQLERFKDLLIEKEKIVSDIVFPEKADPTGQQVTAAETKEDLYRRIGERQRSVNSSLAVLLGKAGYATYVDYEYALAAHHTVRTLRARLKATEPLSQEQANRLFTWVRGSAEKKPLRGAIGLSLEGAAGLSGRPIQRIDDEVLSQARSALSLTQWSELKRLQQAIEMFGY